MIDRFLGHAFGVLSCQFWSTVVKCGAPLSILTLNYLSVQSVVPVFLTGVLFFTTLVGWGFSQPQWGGVFGLIGCKSLSLSLALPTSFNNNNNNSNQNHSVYCSYFPISWILTPLYVIFSHQGASDLTLPYIFSQGGF